MENDIQIITARIKPGSLEYAVCALLSSPLHPFLQFLFQHFIIYIVVDWSSLFECVFVSDFIIFLYYLFIILVRKFIIGRHHQGAPSMSLMLVGEIGVSGGNPPSTEVNHNFEASTNPWKWTTISSQSHKCTLSDVSPVANPVCHLLQYNESMSLDLGRSSSALRASTIVMRGHAHFSRLLWESN